MAGIGVYSRTANSVTIYLTSLDTGWESGTRIVNWYLGSAGGSTPTATSYYKSNTGNSLADKASTSGTVTFDGLSPNTTYGVLCEVYYGTTKLASITGQATTAAPSRPDDFAWTNSKVKGGAFNLTASEWNSFTSRINDFRAYKKLSSYSFDTAHKGNEFTAKMYNQARLAIQGISGYGTYIPTVSSGYEVSADALNILVSELNAIR